MLRNWRAARRWLSVAGVAAALAVLMAEPASAHAVFVGSEPDADAVMLAPPNEVVLHFSDVVQDDISDVIVTAPDGQQFADAVNEGTVIRVQLDTAASGTYAVEWRTTSSLDGHTVADGFEFVVEPPAEPAPQEEPKAGGDTPPAADKGTEAPPRSDEEDAESGQEPTGEADDRAAGPPDALDDDAAQGRRRTVSALAVLVGGGRALEYLGWLVVLGWLTLGAFARSLELDWVPRRLAPWVWAVAVGVVATVTAELVPIGGGDLIEGARRFLPTSGGRMRMIRLALAGLAAMTVVRAAHADDGGIPGRRARVGMALLAMAGLTAIAASGHAATSPGYVAAGAGHLIAAGVWAGTLVAMAMHRPPGGWRGETGRRLLHEFAPIGLTMFAATVVLGSVRAVQELARVSDLWRTTYGQVLSAKVLLVVAMVPLSVLAWRRSRPYLRIEGSLAVAVTVLAAVLASSTPSSSLPTEPSPDTSPPAAADTGQAGQPVAEGLPQEDDLALAGDAGSTVVGVTVRPARPGTNEVFVTLVPPKGVDAAAGLEATLQVAAGEERPLERCGEACRRQTVELAGGETLSIRVDDGESSHTATVEIPPLPVADGTALLAQVEERIQRLGSFRYDEVFGPHQPPTRSSWEVVVPDRNRGVITRGDDEPRETIRIQDRRWRREGVDGSWEGGEPTGVTVRTDRLLWEQPGRTAIKLIGRSFVEGVPTRELAFFTKLRELPIWFRLWVDDDHLVRRVEMRTRGHFMDQRYYDFDAAIDIRPPG